MSSPSAEILDTIGRAIAFPTVSRDSNLALIEWAAAVKLLIFFSLLGNLFVPVGVAMALTPGTLLVALLSLLVKFAVLAAAVAVLETRIAKLRLFRVPELLALSFTLALLAAASSFFTK